ncbi:hypothetical protein [Psychrobacter sp. FBL11]|uniref:hypothetical protein n=1 Tax=Psychrobacter saeujeotis TaxID=3143436 RepID=UPI00262F7A57|nr:hypothetical protein [uncultured Psychrobacter sp.]
MSSCVLLPLDNLACLPLSPKRLIWYKYLLLDTTPDVTEQDVLKVDDACKNRQINSLLASNNDNNKLFKTITIIVLVSA